MHTVDATPQQFDQVDQAMQGLQAKHLALASPPPTEPLDPQLVQLFEDALTRAVQALSEGQLQLPPFGPPQPTGALPEGAVAAALGLEKALGQDYGVADKLRSNAGLKEMIGWLSMVSHPGSGPGAEDSSGGQVLEVGNPYRIEQHGPAFAVVKISDGKVMGTHPTHERALAQFRALEMAAHREG